MPYVRSKAKMFNLLDNIMEKINYLLIIWFAVALMSTSCEKENNPENIRIRVTKIADNQAMENPWYTFEYDSKGLLIKMVEKYGTTTFEYDANGRPTKIDPYSIEWSEDGFTQTHPDWPDRKTVYLVNSNNQIESEIELWQNEETKNHDTVEICNYYWTGDTQWQRISRGKRTTVLEQGGIL